MEAFFDCHPPDSKCEWQAAVRGFALQFNLIRGTDYVRETCFDASPSDGPVPEVRLVATGRPPMVVERKTIEWPSRFLHSHSHWHRLADLLVNLLPTVIPVPATVTIRSDCLQGLSKREVDRVGKTIVQGVRSGKKSGLVTSSVGTSMPWRIDSGLFSAPVGVQIEVSDLEWPPQSWSDFDELSRHHDQQVSGYRGVLAGCLPAVERKFSAFFDHYRVLLLHFVGESDELSELADLPTILGVAQGASFIDEIWIATKKWISEDDYEIVWLPAPGIAQ